MLRADGPPAAYYVVLGPLVKVHLSSYSGFTPRGLVRSIPCLVDLATRYAAHLLPLLSCSARSNLRVRVPADWLFDDECLEVAWKLTASKIDPRALGTSRTRGGFRSNTDLPCPYHLMLKQRQWLIQLSSSIGLSLGGIHAAPSVHGTYAAKRQWWLPSRPSPLVATNRSCPLPD